MRFHDAIESYVRDQWGNGKFTSRMTERDYRATLGLLAEQVSNRDPKLVSRSDVKAVLDRWTHPNTRGAKRSHMVSFFKWAMGEGLVKSNPALQTHAPKRKAAQHYRLNAAEVAALLSGCESVREVRLVYLGVFAGLRNLELRSVRGEHFAREGLIWIPAEFGKGAKQGFVPVLDELRPVVNGIRAEVAWDEFVIPARRPANPPQNDLWSEVPAKQCSSQALCAALDRIAVRAGVAVHRHNGRSKSHVTPHSLRYACADLLAAETNIEVVQQFLRHDEVRTTQIYVAGLSPDRLAAAVRGVHFGLGPAIDGLSVQKVPSIPVKATTGLEPV